MKKAVLAALALATAAAIPSAALADSVFNWTYGGGSDPVYAYGTLTATPDASITGAWDITGGSGFRTFDGNTFDVTIVPFSQSNDPSQCSYSPSSNCTVVASGGVSADLIFDNVLYAGNGVNFQLDGDGFVLSEANGPDPDGQYFSVWGTGSSSQLGPQDQEFDPYSYAGINLTNGFDATLAPTPEPGSLLLLGTGLLGLAAISFRKVTS